MHINYIEKKIADLENHIIVCGYGRYGREVAGYFFKHQQSFVVVESNEEKIRAIQASSEKLLYVEGDATQDNILEKAGIKKASALIAALAEDSDNVFTVLTARQLNPKLSIISRAYQEKTMKKLKLAGANHVIMPEQIGGFYMASLVTRPNAVEFFSYITNEKINDIGFEEASYEMMPEDYQGKSIRELNIRAETGTNIIGFQTPEGKYIVNPTPDTVLEPGSSFFVIGSAEQLKSFRKLFKIEEGD